MSAKKISITRSAALMGFGTFCSRILGLVREQVFAFFFGAGHLTDAYNIAFRIPNLLRDLFAEGAMSAALVPTFTEAEVKEGSKKAWQIAGLVFVVLFLLTLMISAVGYYFSDWLVSLYAPSFSKVTGKHELTVVMTRIMMGFFPFIVLGAAFMGVLNAKGVFFVPAFASAVFNFFSISVGLIFIYLAPYFNMSEKKIIGMAIGVVVGGVAQAAFQWPSLRREGFTWHKISKKWYREPYLKKMFSLMIPGVVGLSATQISIFINSILATSMGVGAVSYLAYASRLIGFPMGIFGVSFAQATLPVFSTSWSKGEIRESGDHLLNSMAKITVITVIATSFLCSLSIPIIRVIFEHGAFKPLDSHNTALALVGYAVGLPAGALVRLIVPVCYAMSRTRVAVAGSIISILLGLTFNVFFGQKIGFAGLALGSSIASWLNLAWLLYWVSGDYKARNIKFKWKVWVYRSSKSLLAGFITAGASYSLWNILDGKWLHIFKMPTSWLGDAVNLLVLLGVGFFIALAALKLFKVEELELFINNAKSRILKKLMKQSK